MFWKLTPSCLLVLSIAFASALPSAVAQTYTITDLGLGVTNSQPNGINNYGQVVGTGSNGKQYTLKNVQNQYGSAPINSQQQVHEIYHTNNGQNVVKLFVQLNHGNAGGWFKQAFITHHHGHKLECVTPGGQATAAGKVFFSMHVQ